jgi:hypothetical protein
MDFRLVPEASPPCVRLEDFLWHVSQNSTTAEGRLPEHTTDLVVKLLLQDRELTVFSCGVASRRFQRPNNFVFDDSFRLTFVRYSIEGVVFEGVGVVPGESLSRPSPVGPSRHHFQQRYVARLGVGCGLLLLLGHRSDFKVLA